MSVGCNSDDMAMVEISFLQCTGSSWLHAVSVIYFHPL